MKVVQLVPQDQEETPQEARERIDSVLRALLSGEPVTGRAASSVIQFPRGR